MRWTAWSNGAGTATGAGYGLRVSARDRDRVFRPHWRTVTLELRGLTMEETIEVNLDKPSFWRRCPELIDQRIGRWLLALGLAPWPLRRPPGFEGTLIEEARFRVTPHVLR